MFKQVMFSKLSSSLIATAVFGLAAASAQPHAPAGRAGSVEVATEILRGIQGKELVPVKKKTGKPVDHSRVVVRMVETGTSEPVIELDVLLRSMPERTTGPDDDTNGANAAEVNLRSAELISGSRSIVKLRRFDFLHQDSKDEKDEEEEDDTSAPSSECRGLYTGATREYAPGKSGPAFFQSRCLIQVPFRFVREALASQDSTELTLKLYTKSGYLIVPLVAARSDARVQAANSQPRDGSATTIRAASRD